MKDEKKEGKNQGRCIKWCNVFTAQIGKINGEARRAVLLIKEKKKKKRREKER